MAEAPGCLMKVSMWYNNRDIRLEEVPTPEPSSGEMLVKVHACGICGSDVVEWYRLPRAPLVQGHEVAAEVVECGPGVDDFKPGDRVFIAPKVPCLECYYCRNGHYPQCTEIKGRLPGGYAEYILAPADLVDKGTYQLPDKLDYEVATFIEPLACVIRARRLAGVQPGQNVLVLGSGISGVLHVKEAKRQGCTVTATDVNPYKLEFARKSGADHALDASDNVPEKLLELTGRKADVVMITASALPAIEQAWASVDKGGTIVFFTVPGPGKKVTIPVNDFWTREISVLTSYYAGPPDFTEAISLLAGGEIIVSDLITHRFPLEKTPQGFELMLTGSDSMKAIIKPHMGTEQ
jgi:L-iditol 2-dehydrogenase